MPALSLRQRERAIPANDAGIDVPH